MIKAKIILNEDSNSCDICGKRHKKLVEIIAPYDDCLVIGERCFGKFYEVIQSAKESEK